MTFMRVVLLVLLGMILLSALIVYLKLRRVDFALGDLVQGLVLLVPALLVKIQPPSR